MINKRTLKKRVFSGDVCEQIVYTAPESVSLRDPVPRPRFRNQEEREKYNLLVSKRRFARIVNANFTPSSYYCTLTFDNDWEVHTFEEAKVLRERYIRRLRGKNPDAKIVVVMGRGKGTKRIHFHMICDGLSEEEITGAWNYGKVVTASHLREHVYYNGVDHGRDYTGLANYLFDHWTPEQGERSHRYRATRNLAKPDEEKATICKRKYTDAKPPAAPKGFVLVESMGDTFGHLWFKYVREPKGKKRE